ncbi:MAG: hypothetical protein H6599_02190 [Flavobacteriales bacterium]|nr:hypothetical protein [Flavobacteriales bacterium]
MQVTVEISKYPLKDEYVKPIKDFIDRVIVVDGITVITNNLSTQISGDYDLVLSIITKEIKNSFEKFGKSVFVMKILSGNLLED